MIFEGGIFLHRSVHIAQESVGHVKNFTNAWCECLAPGLDAQMVQQSQLMNAASRQRAIKQNAHLGIKSIGHVEEKVIRNPLQLTNVSFFCRQYLAQHFGGLGEHRLSGLQLQCILRSVNTMSALTARVRCRSFGCGLRTSTKAFFASDETTFALVFISFAAIFLDCPAPCDFKTSVPSLAMC